MSQFDTIHQNHFRSKSDDYVTPQPFFDDLNNEFNFTLDAAATSENAKCPKFYTKEDNGLNYSWEGETVWINPPYGGRGTIERWVKKAYQESFKGVTSVLLLPVRTDVGYWHDYCMKGEIRFIRGRLRFKNPVHNDDGSGGAPFASAVVIFRGQNA